MTSTRIFLIVLFLSSVAFAQESKYEFGAGISSPYVFDPHNGIGDTTLHVGFDFDLYRNVFLHQGLNYGLLGSHFFRYEMGPQLRLLQNRRICPLLDVGPVFQFDPYTSVGFYTRFGALFDLSRWTGIYFFKIKAESGVDLFFSNISRNEWEIFRISLVYGF